MIKLDKLNVEGFTPKEGQAIQIHKGMLVGVHVNSHQNCLSIVAMKSQKSRHSVGLVLGYAQSITLSDCTTHIEKSKQKKVKMLGKKDRHAYIVGYVQDFNAVTLEKGIYYKPEHVDNFVDAQSYFQNGEILEIGSVRSVNLQVCPNSGKPQVTYQSWDSMENAI